MFSKKWVPLKILLITVAFIGCSENKFRSSEFKINPANPTVNIPTTDKTPITPQDDGSDSVNPDVIYSSIQLTIDNVDDIINEIPRCNTVVNNNVVQCLIIKDSFERNGIFDLAGQPDFGWSRIIDDVAGANGEKVSAEIYREDDLGPTLDSITDVLPDLHRAVWFSGRPGGSVHSIFLISKPLDLSNFNSVMIGFKYLAADLERWTWSNASDFENIRLEVCQQGIDGCGLGAEVDEEKLNSSAWKEYYRSVPNIIDGLNGHNHELSDWMSGFADIDLRNYSDEAKQRFIFRIAVTIDEGFSVHNGNSPVISSDMKDGVGLDNVIALASTLTVDDENPDPQDGEALLQFSLPNPVFLGSFPVNQSSTFTVELSNVGNGAASNIVYNFLDDPDGIEFSLENTTCGLEIPATGQAGSTCILTISYTPNPGGTTIDEDTLSVNYFNGNDSDEIFQTFQAVGQEGGDGGEPVFGGIANPVILRSGSQSARISWTNPDESDDITSIVVSAFDSNDAFIEETTVQGHPSAFFIESLPQNVFYYTVTVIYNSNRDNQKIESDEIFVPGL